MFYEFGWVRCAVAFTTVGYKAMFVMALYTLNLSMLALCVRPLLILFVMTGVAHIGSCIFLDKLHL